MSKPDKIYSYINKLVNKKKRGNSIEKQAKDKEHSISERETPWKNAWQSRK